MYIYEHRSWPDFTWDHRKIIKPLSEVRYAQGRLFGRLELLGFENLSDTVLENLTQDILKTSEIEGEILSKEQVRSSLGRRLGIDSPGYPSATRDVDGIVDMTLDAMQNYDIPLTEERLFGWHNALFPSGRSGVFRITVADWRRDQNGRMQVISGTPGKEKIHFEAPEAAKIPGLMKEFLSWLNDETNFDDLLIKAAVAHLYFVTLHPFDDGNGRIGRTITDMILARSDDIPRRFYSMSAQIMNQRKEYYEILETTQKDSLNITRWISWFLDCLTKAIRNSENLIEKVLIKYRFWQKASILKLNSRQQKILNLLLDGFQGKLNTSKWAKLTKCSTDTALRDIQELLKLRILIKGPEGGRSTSYSLNPDY